MTLQSPPQTLADPLDRGNIEALVHGRHGSPFDILGPHTGVIGGQPVWIVRAFLPGASAVSLALYPSDDRRSWSPSALRLPMTLLHPAGLYSLVAPGDTPPRYRLSVQSESGAAAATIEDPYAFPPVLTGFDLHLIGEGKHLEIYNRLGAHPFQLRGVSGVLFAVWAPNARRVSVVGDFNRWDERAHPMRMRTNGVWELFIPDLAPGALYKYAILSWNHEYQALKADPLAFAAEVRPGTASRVWDLSGYTWGDEEWMRERPTHDAPDRPMCVYEAHLGSWRPNSGPGDGAPTYRDLAHQLAPYAREMGYTHIELMPIAEHPFDGSWGYQVTGYYAPTSRYGTPQDFMYFVDYCHQQGLGVLLDWVPAHFPKDEHGLNYFDGSHLYEHDDPRQGEHPDWGTLIFNFGRNEVRNFLIANALFWLETYHIDGLRVDAVASMLYLDYSREAGQWLPNRFGGRENLDAVSFLRECNAIIHERHPDALMIAEESTAWPYVTAPVKDGGLGFSLKWNMGWMHDLLDYAHYDPVYRSHHQNELTFSFVYAFSERFVLPFSHDEVVHMKGSMLNKMPGDRWQKFANLRALYAFMYAHPGKKLLFMGGEFAQWSEWNFAGYLDWFLLDPTRAEGENHRQTQRLVRDLNELLRAHPALYECDFTPEGFEWVDGSDTAHSVIAFLRHDKRREHSLLIVCNFTPVPHYAYRVGAAPATRYAEVFNSDAAVFGGSNVGNLGGVETEAIPMHGRDQSVALTLPPLAVIMLEAERAPAHVTAKTATGRRTKATKTRGDER
ncbi:MAG TPA: 1,4-alpha-glucan branching protein GlgB [Ktedonobacterales bacterium]|nr:1,4-alpha-glucan branching protein GlgB [Ktedonobacterales bacterium]